MDKLEIVDKVTELYLHAEGLKAVFNAFTDAFGSERDPDKLAEAVRVRPEHYQYLLYDIENMINDIVTRAKEIEEA